MDKLKRMMASSIKSRILLSILVCIAIVTLALSIASTTSNYLSTINTLEQSLFETAKLAGDKVTESLKVYKTAMDELAADELFSQEVIDPAKVEARFTAFKEDYGFSEVNYTDDMGVTPDGMNVGFEDYYGEAKVFGAAYVSDLYIAADGASFYIAAPIMRNGSFKGVVFAKADGKQLSDITNKIKIGDDGTAFILNQAGDTIASPNFDDVLAQLNVQSAVEEDKSLKQLAEIQGKMTSLISGTDSYKDDGISRIISYYPIPETENWSIGVTVNKWEFLSGLFISVFVTLGFAVLVFIFAIFMSRKIAASISDPIQSCVERMKLLANGDVTTDVVTFDNIYDETGVLARETEKTVADLREVIIDVSEVLTEIANGNMAIDFNRTYHGDFAPISDAIQNIINQMSGVIGNIQEFANMVSTGSDQVSIGAQALSQGATEQASAIEELAATIQDVLEKVKSNAANAKDAKIEVDNVNNAVDSSNVQMSQLVAAMRDINNNSEEIKKILETIEDISFQTNILALNAAIEAAKAGVAGRGFSVVAEEVRTLAEKSSEAAQSTAELIETTIASVEHGSSIVNDTAKSLNAVVEATKTVTANIEQIATASNEQAASISEITVGVDQIASVVQNNSATAEESAASSTELSGQAKKLEQLVSQFNISEEALKNSHLYADMYEDDFSMYDDDEEDYTYEPEADSDDDKYFAEDNSAPVQAPVKKTAPVKPVAKTVEKPVKAVKAEPVKAPVAEPDKIDDFLLEDTEDKKPNAFVGAMCAVGRGFAKAGKGIGGAFSKLFGKNKKKLTPEELAEKQAKKEAKKAKKANKKSEKAMLKAAKQAEKNSPEALAKKAEKEAEKANKKSEKAMLKVAKKAEKDAKKAAKEAEKNSPEALAKKAEKEAEKANKKSEKAMLKAAKKAENEAKKAEKKAAKENKDNSADSNK